MSFCIFPSFVVFYCGLNYPLNEFLNLNDLKSGVGMSWKLAKLPGRAKGVRPVAGAVWRRRRPAARGPWRRQRPATSEAGAVAWRTWRRWWTARTIPCARTDPSPKIDRSHLSRCWFVLGLWLESFEKKTMMIYMHFGIHLWEASTFLMQIAWDPYIGLKMSNWFFLASHI